VLCPATAIALLAVVAAPGTGAAPGHRAAADGSAAPAPTAKPTTVIPDSQLPAPGAFMGPARRVRVNGIEIGFRQFGAGPDLLMITGDTAPMSLWMPYLLRPLARHFTVTIFDNRGVGYSTDDTSKRLTVKLMARDTARLIRALDLKEPTVAGWSMGGEIALTMAARRVEELGAVVTTGGDAGSRHTIPPPKHLIDELNDPNAPYTVALKLLFPRTPAGQAAQDRFVDGFLSIPQEPVSARILRRQANAELNFLKSRWTWRRLSRIEVPTLITNGARDRGVPVANARTLARRIPGAKLSIYRGAAHGMMFQNAGRFAAQVTRFARRNRVGVSGG
jgi:pimeloyl-ACP methyl ester carboxylesterase